MNKKITILLAATTLAAGAAFAVDALPSEGLFNDAQFTRENGGVGNYLFRYAPNEPLAEETWSEAQSEAEPIASNFEDDPTEPMASTESDDISLGASSAGRAH